MKPTMVRRLLRWAGFSHEGPIRVKARHWWEWRRANRVERFLNWQQSRAEFKQALQESIMASLLYGPTAWPSSSGFYGLGIGDLLGHNGSNNGSN